MAVIGIIVLEGIQRDAKQEGVKPLK